MLCECKDSNFLAEEFMLLASGTAAEILSRAYPDSALLQSHPEPNMRKLREFEAFCSNHGLELDASSSGSFHRSLERIREKLKDDTVFLSTLNSTSPLRRYPDIVVYHILAAAMEAEEMYLKHQKVLNKVKQTDGGRCSTGVYFDNLAAESQDGQKALSVLALKHKVPHMEILSDVAAYCNNRKLASSHVKDAVDRLYMWSCPRMRRICQILLGHFLLCCSRYYAQRSLGSSTEHLRDVIPFDALDASSVYSYRLVTTIALDTSSSTLVEVLVFEARVLGPGPRFIPVYIHKLTIERSIYYDEVEGLMVEWFEATSMPVLSFCPNKSIHHRRSPGKFKALEYVVWVVSPSDVNLEADDSATQNGDSSLPCQSKPGFSFKTRRVGFSNRSCFFPSDGASALNNPFALHAVGGDDGPLDIAARLYMTSYFS
ncbi:hypothetical protein Ancab_038271 [Ancistrocladus abbreviatus]